MVPNLNYDIHAMLEEIGELKREWQLQGKGGKVEAVRRALTKTIEVSKNVAMIRNQIKKKKRKSKGTVGPENIVEGHRKRGKNKLEVPNFTPPPEPSAGTETNLDKIFEMEEEAARFEENAQGKSRKGFKVLDRVKVKTTRFGKTFAKGRPTYTHGTIMKMKEKVCDVQWDDSEGVDLMKSHRDFLEPDRDSKKDAALMAMFMQNEPWFSDRMNSIRTILPVLEVGAAN